MSRKKKGALPATASEKGKQLPLYAKMPKHHSTYPGLFVSSPDRTPIAKRGKLKLSKEDIQARTEGFERFHELRIPESYKKASAREEYSITDAALIARGPHKLGANELRIYQAVLSIALAEGGGSRADLTLARVSTPRAKSLRAELGYQELRQDPSGNGGLLPARDSPPILKSAFPDILRPILEPSIITLRTSSNAIIHAAGLPRGGQSDMAILAALRALSAVTITAQFGVTDRAGRSIVEERVMRILRYRSITATSGEAKVIDSNGKVDGRLRNTIEIAFDPYVTEVLNGNPQPAYTLIEMEETGKLGDIALLLHYRLCSIIDRGKSLKIGMGKLVSYVYGDMPELDAQDGTGVIRKRRGRLRSALEELHTLGWEVVLLRKGTSSNEELWMIGRPSARADRSMPSFAAIAAMAGQAMDFEIPPDAPSLDPGDDSTRWR